MIEYIENFVISLIFMLLFFIMYKNINPPKNNIKIIPKWKLESRKNIRRLYRGPGTVINLEEKRKNREVRKETWKKILYTLNTKK